MKLMNDRVFLDSNVLVYSYSNSEIVKQEIARNLILENNTYISTQVLQELCNVITRKFKFDYTVAITTVSECIKNNIVLTNTGTTIIKACKIADQYKFSFYDSVIIASALECNCTILYSEDMHDGHLIDNRLTIKNPFK